jgi:hypothetical protein
MVFFLRRTSLYLNLTWRLSFWATCLGMGCMVFLLSSFVSSFNMHRGRTVLPNRFTVMYSHRFPKDPLWIKTLGKTILSLKELGSQGDFSIYIVWFLFFVDTLITILSTIAGWHFLASGWGNPATLIPLDWAFSGVPLLSGIGMY